MRIRQPLETLVVWASAVLAAVSSLTGTAGAQGFGTSRSSRSSTAYYPSSTEMGSATFSTDPETRKLVVVTDESTAAYISQVVSNLDRPPPQVMIKVVFLEVTHRKGMDIGLEANHTRQLGDTTLSLADNFRGMSGLTSPGNLESLIGLAGTDFGAQLTAIAQAGKLEVLSRPTILARNNQEAIITVGQQVPLITNVRYDTFGNQINGITYQDVGIILRVTPFITSGDMVEMIVSPEISNLSEQTVAVSTGTNTVGAPVINRRSADTVVVTPDGQTVVIGGLMENSKTETVSKVPFLGDIPLLGALFRRKVTGDTKTELLIFLTPHIIRLPAQLASMTDNETGRTAVAPKAFSEEELDRFFDRLPRRENPGQPEPKR